MAVGSIAHIAELLERFSPAQNRFQEEMKMRAKTRPKLFVAAQAALGIVVPTFIASQAMASVTGIYSADGNTAILYHFDESAGATIAANAQPVSGNGIAWLQSS